MKILECPSLGEGRVKHMYESIDNWLRSPALAALVKSFGSEIPSYPITIDLGAWLLDFSERWDFRKVQQEATSKDTGKRARWLITDSSLITSQHDIIEKSARKLGLIGIEIPSKNFYDFVWVLGGARLSNRLRPRLAAHLVTEHPLHCSTIALLASGRPISLTERNATDTYAPNAKTEFDLINRGAEIEFNIPSSFIEERNDDAANTNKRWFIRRYDKTGSLPYIMSIRAPSSEP